MLYIYKECISKQLISRRVILQGYIDVALIEKIKENKLVYSPAEPFSLICCRWESKLLMSSGLCLIIFTAASHDEDRKDEPKGRNQRVCSLDLYLE